MALLVKILVIAFFISKVSPTRRIVNSLNFTSSDPSRVKILDYGFSGPAFSISCEILQPLDNFYVG